MDPITGAIFIGLGTYKFTDTVRQLCNPPAAAVSGLSGAVSVMLGLFLFTSLPQVGLAAWGISAIAHEITSLLSLLADSIKQGIILRSSGRAAPRRVPPL